MLYQALCSFSRALPQDGETSAEATSLLGPVAQGDEGQLCLLVKASNPDEALERIAQKIKAAAADDSYIFGGVNAVFLEHLIEIHDELNEPLITHISVKDVDEYGDEVTVSSLLPLAFDGSAQCFSLDDETDEEGCLKPFVNLSE